MSFHMNEALAKKRFADFMVTEMERKKLTQSELGRRTSIHVSAINRYVHAEELPMYDRFIRINKAFGRSPGRTFMRVFYGEK